MLYELIKYLKILFKQSNRLERTDNNGKIYNSFKEKYLVRIILFILSISIIYFLKKGFTNDFVSLISSVLSILVGLFITALIFSFDKFYEPSKSEDKNSRIKVWETQAYNYAKRFAFITSKTIVLSIFTLTALVLSSLFPFQFNINIFEYSFIDNSSEVSEGIKIFFKIFLNLFQRFFVLYFLLKIAYNTLFIVTSMVQYMTINMDRK